MTPKEKAIELKEKFQNIEFNAKGFDEFGEPNLRNMGIERVKQCCLISIDEIENALIDCGELSDQLQNMDRELNFWQNVRKAIETL